MNNNERKSSAKIPAISIFNPSIKPPLIKHFRKPLSKPLGIQLSNHVKVNQNVKFNLNNNIKENCSQKNTNSPKPKPKNTLLVDYSSTCHPSIKNIKFRKHPKLYDPFKNDITSEEESKFLSIESEIKNSSSIFGNNYNKNINVL